MKIFFKIFLMVYLAVGLQAEPNKEADEMAIRKIVQSNQEAYNNQDAIKLMASWAPDAVFSNPLTDEFAEGKEAIEKLFKDKFALGVKRHIEIIIKSIEFPNQDEAIEKGIMQITIENLPKQKVAYQSEYVKKEGKWLVQSIREIPLQEPSTHYQHLKDLAWLIGKWKDTDENSEIVFNTEWDKYKNFITQHFKMKILGEEDIEGKQIIAWDSVKNKVRSWVFDSDGGFGEGTWEKENDSWYATMRYTLSDGRQASAINIYKPSNNQSYTFSSVEREVEGEILPDMNPTTIQRVE